MNTKSYHVGFVASEDFCFGLGLVKGTHSFHLVRFPQLGVASGMQQQRRVLSFVCPGYFLEQNMDEFESTMNLNYFGTLKVIQAALPDMVERRQGEIVLVSSAAAVVGSSSILNSLQFVCHTVLSCELSVQLALCTVICL